jgi:BlaR1 peptidase M56
MNLPFLTPLLRLPLPAAWAAAIGHTDLFIQPGPATSIDINAAKTGPPGASGWLLPRPSIYYYIAYIAIALLFLWPLLRSLRYLFLLSRDHPSERMPGFRLYRTREPGTPFSFLRHLFWKDSIPLDTAKGQAILQHELVHIRQHHSIDLLFFETVRALAWCNPFFHFQLRDLKLVHEFLADHYALQTLAPQPGGHPRADYAEWLVLEAGGSVRPSTHSFYALHLQKRITMILQPTGPRGLLRQTAALPLTILLCCAFAHTPARHLATPGKELMHFYTRHLRYPPAALQQGLEQTVSFSLRIGEHNQLLEFKPKPVNKVSAGANTGRITVTARAVQAGKTASPGAAEPDYFMQELKAVSEGISTDTTVAYPPGEYAFTIIFRLEPAQ